MRVRRYSVVIGLGAIACNATKLASVRERGFFDGYTPITWLSIVIQSLGGIIIAATSRRAGFSHMCF